MKKKDLEKMLKNEIESSVPFVLPNVLKAPCNIEDVVQAAETKAKDKPYFQFRYIYASLVILTVLMIGFSTMIPQAKTNGILSGGIVVAEEYEVYTTLVGHNVNISMISNEEDKVVSLVINGVAQLVVVGESIENAIYYIAGVLDNIDTTDIELNIESKNTYNPADDVTRIQNVFKVVLNSVGIEI